MSIQERVQQLFKTIMFARKTIVCVIKSAKGSCYQDVFQGLKRAFVRMSVVESQVLDVLVWLIGWMYFFFWSISFYPQIYLNYKRKSVVGLNFDFLSLNIVGFIAYSLFNLLHYFNNTVQEEYMTAHPRSPLPVLANDVVFAVHALIACAFTAVQCFIYERGDQRVSKTCWILASTLLFLGFFAGGFSVVHRINLLEFADTLSFIKLAVTCSKYVPQALFNYQRKSTVGWAIENVLADFTGGFLCILQMVLESVNVKDWTVFYGNPVKEDECGSIRNPDMYFPLLGAMNNEALESDEY